MWPSLVGSIRDGGGTARRVIQYAEFTKIIPRAFVGDHLRSASGLFFDQCHPATQDEAYTV